MAIFKLRSIHSNNDVSIFCDCRRQKSMIVDRLIHSKQEIKKIKLVKLYTKSHGPLQGLFSWKYEHDWP